MNQKLGQKLLFISLQQEAVISIKIKYMKIVRTLSFFLLLIIVASCSQKGANFVVEGTISDADSTMLYLEKRELNQSTLIDSVRLTQNGNFKFEQAATPYPEFYILKLGKEVINLAIDSAETIKVEASKINFATNYNVFGSETNNLIKELTLAQYKANSEYSDLVKKRNTNQINNQTFAEGIDSLSNSYRQLATKIVINDPKNPAAYFALFQKVDDYLFFDPYKKNDYKVFGAVATAWDSHYKQSPRSEQLKKFALTALKVRKQEEQVQNIEPTIVNSREFFNIELPDVNGKDQSLSSLRGKIVLLDFIAYELPESPAHNMYLRKVYDKYKDQLEIYQVSFDSDRHFWKNAAINLPWITVFDDQSIESPLIQKFNIPGLPTIYLFDREGNIVKRIDNFNDIEKEVGKII